jgi:hypothetical protein
VSGSSGARVSAASYTVATTATKIAVGRPGGRTVVYVQNGDAQPIFVGGSGVTTSGATKGASVAAAGTLTLYGEIAGEFYAISAAGTSANAVAVLEAF